MKIQISKMHNQSGFTLIEALVAISILLIALASPMVLAQKGITAAELSQNQMIASFLAQDGIEAVKNIRDQDAVSTSSDADPSGSDWLYGLNNCICTRVSSCNLNNLATAQYCNIDTTDINLLDGYSVIAKFGTHGVSANPIQIATSNSNGSFLKYDLLAAPSGYTNHPSPFSRYINIFQTPGNSNEALVQVMVSWVSPVGPQSVTIEDFIYNYSENIN